MVIFFGRVSLVLQRILELQKEATVADDALAFLHAGSNLGAASMAVSELDQAARELVLFRGGLYVDKGLILGIAQDGSVGNCQSIGDGTGIDGRRDVHILLQLVARVFRDYAGLRGACVGIERGSDVRNFPVKCVGIGIGSDVHAISGVHVGD